VDTVVGLIAGPVGWLTVLAVIGLLVARQFARERRPVTVPPSTSLGTVLTVCAVALAAAVLVLRFYGFVP
jgi:hypothetical protein